MIISEGEDLLAALSNPQATRQPHIKETGF
jgi:hypothetical protein